MKALVQIRCVFSLCVSLLLFLGGEGVLRNLLKPFVETKHLVNIGNLHYLGISHYFSPVKCG